MSGVTAPRRIQPPAADFDTDARTVPAVGRPEQADADLDAPWDLSVGFDAVAHSSRVVTTIDWCTGTVISRERIEHVGERWSPVRRPMIVSGVIFLDGCPHQQYRGNHE
ncbi:hypothetical protein DFJ67_6990 [Asanoa ferruginea]|uniref:Uncharacterized protein n=1 Tax=Asanoa ferruginea TaxID=53367 RepID=A0A3D9ZU55_9ACTN|nr:hypothetical protein [Asanoa ferruginea]REG00929.1 hypothetical protein DFJ67_6990 [Asanoa ferruginea]GIF47513.1 hypothetical protein Afe04nite_20520 [Asanoa ferruginea]